MRQSEIRFIRQLGLAVANPDHQLYVALMFQPRTVAAAVMAGILLQSGWLFLGLSAALWWSAVLPGLNLFDAAYSRLIARQRGLLPVPTAPAPRRFAQAMAASVALAIGLATLSGATVIAWLFEGLFGIASTAVVVGRVCPPAALYLRLVPPDDGAVSGPRRG